MASLDPLQKMVLIKVTCMELTFCVRWEENSWPNIELAISRMNSHSHEVSSLTVLEKKF